MSDQRAWLFLPLALTLSFGLLALVVPLVRLAVRHRRWGIARRRDPVQRMMTLSLLAGVALALGWSVVLPVLGPEPLDVWALPAPVGLLGIACAVVGLGVVVLAQAQMGAAWRIGIVDEETGLVTSGLYARIRHPIYTGLLLCLAALVLVTPSPWTVMAALWVGSIVAIQARMEEAHLSRQHGAAFGSWAARTGRFWPGLGTLAGGTP